MKSEGDIYSADAEKLKQLVKENLQKEYTGLIEVEDLIVEKGELIEKRKRLAAFYKQPIFAELYLLQKKAKYLDDKYSSLGHPDVEHAFIGGFRLHYASYQDVEEHLTKAFQDKLLAEKKDKSTKFNDALDSNDRQWLKNTIKDLFKETHQQLQSTYKEVENIIKSRKEDNHIPIIWGIPQKTGNKDHFIYSGKTKEKTVYKPFTAIHQALIKANWLFRKGNRPTGNYLTSHILFTVSDRPHTKAKINEKNEEHYQGGRTYIDFPIILEFKESGEGIFSLNSQNGVGRFLGSLKKDGSHSEDVLKKMLLEPSNMEAIISALKQKLKEHYESTFKQELKDAEMFKVYEMNLFINSNKNICSYCEATLHSLTLPPSPADDNSNFLSLLKSELKKQGFKTLSRANETYPRMFVSVSSYESYSDREFCSARADNNAKVAFGLERSLTTIETASYYIDTKLLADNKVILSTPESWVNREPAQQPQEYNKYIVDQEKHYQQLIRSLFKDDIPRYSGFVSGSESRQFLNLEQLRILDSTTTKEKAEENQQNITRGRTLSSASVPFAKRVCTEERASSQHCK